MKNASREKTAIVSSLVQLVVAAWKEPGSNLPSVKAEKAFAALNRRRADLIFQSELSVDEAKELELLQTLIFGVTDWLHPKKPMSELYKLTENLGEPPIWTDEECFQLNAAQHNPYFHGYTCGEDSRHPPLIATRYGWRCCAKGCGYRQGWAHGVGERKLESGKK